MTTANLIDLNNLKRLAETGSPNLSETLEKFLQQPDPQPAQPVRQGALTVDAFLRMLSAAQAQRTPQRRREKSTEAWQRFLEQTDPEPPPRFQLADLLVKLYEDGAEPVRAEMLEAFQSAPLVFGAWGGIKRIYKLAEARLDAQMFGALAYRFDVELTRFGRREVSRGTLIYLRRRAWRFLRELGRSVPELYPQFAVEVLRHYDTGTNFRALWVANHVWAHGSKKYNRQMFFAQNPPSDMVKFRAYPEAWKRSPDALMLLLEVCKSDPAARFAIEGMRKDFPEQLRNVTPEWLGRLAHRPLASAHEFLVETLLGSPELHQAKLRAKGLHEAVLALLLSPSDKARTYAIEYARAHAQDMEAERLVGLLATSFRDTRGFAASVLTGRGPRTLGYALLGRLLSVSEVNGWAVKGLSESFDRSELPESFLIDMLFGDRAQQTWSQGYLQSRYEQEELGPELWKKVLDDPRSKQVSGAADHAMRMLAKYKASRIGAAWLLEGLARPEISSKVAQLLKDADSLPGLDVERVKGLVFSAKTRDAAFSVLGNRKLVTSRQIGLPWLLALARRADPQLHTFARRYLLEHLKPGDFAESGEREAGIARLFELALGDKEPEPMRAFGQTYLRCHHPVLGPEQPEVKALGLKQALTQDSYTAERVWPGLFDHREDVRRFAAAVTRVELRRWGYQARVYALAESEAREVRTLASDALRKVGEPSAVPTLTLLPEELSPEAVFGLTESTKRAARELGLELIQKHYARLGGPTRLGWLMQSADRDVRTFAVRLLWEKHRPRDLPAGWKPRGARDQASLPADFGEGGTFADLPALQAFLRYVMFGLPGGRQAEGRDEAASKRKLPASVAKRHVVEVVRDLAVEDAAFAQVVVPLLSELTGSIAKGEWQACLSALMHLRKAHPGLAIEGIRG
ncbi:hypothetical protein [Chondromyces apiculatus]|uniref:Uncharacterized protein n=1 Tax=Chondromyces apiculatus DSM 436 TaxID=1192034 RepID=A0A017SZN9_9BACT|nr:hypothetical protein [Chondromyces apiculatus]EYF02438.1 Hypothetical protein CAP_7060 [Chondromyces apiculatus DSM 436]